MTLIAITQRTEDHVKYDESRDTLDRRWYDLLNFCNVTPLIIPNNPCLTQKIINRTSLQGVLLSGGNESLHRIQTETTLFEFAIKNKLPVLGVCHGMQFIQKYFGLNMTKISNHVSAKSEILINKIPTEVNSYHDYGTKQTTSSLIIWAQAHDGIVKAIHHCNLPIVGIMWHPERYKPLKMRDIHFIKKFFSGEFPQCVQLY